ncbi:MAG TPA: hypothetical protein VFP84_35360 [Kofleriaceae bacterium]|nr:hypothetical protein [Kofleriaceae bacterium]
MKHKKVKRPLVLRAEVIRNIEPIERKDLDQVQGAGFITTQTNGPCGVFN